MLEIGGFVLAGLLVIVVIIFLLSLIASLKKDELSKFQSLRLMIIGLAGLCSISLFLINSNTEYGSVGSRGLANAFISFVIILAVFYTVYKSKKKKLEDESRK